MKEQLVAIPAVLGAWWIQRELCQGGQVVRLAVRRRETQGIPPGVANMADKQGVAIVRAQRFVVFGTLLAMRVVREVIRLRHIAKGGADDGEHFTIGRHMRLTPRITSGGLNLT